MTDASRRGSAKSAPQAEIAAEKHPKTAVVLIHGMGEQRPMATLWGFVDAIWSSDRSMVLEYDAPIYAKPDTINDSVDLRRVTTRYWEGDDSRRVDFFEYYWAHLMRGNTVRGTIQWILALFLRRPSSVPTGLRYVWAVGLVLLLTAVALLGLAALPEQVALLFLDKLQILGLSGVSAVGGLVAAWWIAPVAGDAARYFSTNPDNVEARKSIISNGTDVIEKLTRSGEYDRIIVVGHSLGTAIGLDILHHAFGRVTPVNWADTHAQGGAAAIALQHLEECSLRLSPDPKGLPRDVDEDDFNTFRMSQRQYAASLRQGWERGAAAWIVSDFVTLGSPLSKADVLVARDEPAFALLADRRQVPTCPPKLEQRKPPRFSFPGPERTLIPHFGAVFGPTVWTNIFFPNRWIMFGDVISGAVAPLFGQGIRDVLIPHVGLRFRHLDYWWSPDPKTAPDWIVALRKAVNLRLRDERTLWGRSQSDWFLPLPDARKARGIDFDVKDATPIDPQGAN